HFTASIKALMCPIPGFRCPPSQNGRASDASPPKIAGPIRRRARAGGRLDRASGPPLWSAGTSSGDHGPMDTRDVSLDPMGNTPLIDLRQASAATGCRILGKAEFLNPGGSVKDRAALAIVRDAEAKGRLRPGGVIVEGTAGNTGIGLALVGNALGYRTVIVIP